MGIVPISLVLFFVQKKVSFRSFLFIFLFFPFSFFVFLFQKKSVFDKKESKKLSVLAINCVQKIVSFRKFYCPKKSQCWNRAFQKKVSVRGRFPKKKSVLGEKSPKKSQFSSLWISISNAGGVWVTEFVILGGTILLTL